MREGNWRAKPTHEWHQGCWMKGEGHKVGYCWVYWYKTLSEHLGINGLAKIQEDYVNVLLEWLLTVWKHDNSYQWGRKARISAENHEGNGSARMDILHKSWEHTIYVPWAS